MKPIIITKTGTLSKEDISVLRENGVCVVESEDPGSVRLFEPLHAISSRTEIENAAIRLSRKLLATYNHPYDSAGSISCKNVHQLYVKMLIEGTPLDERGSEEERLKKVREDEKFAEARRIGAAEAREERLKKK